MRHEEEQIKELLMQSAEKLDAAHVAAPDFLLLKKMVEKQQAAQRRAQRLQLALFAVVAVFLLSAVFVMTGMFQMFFLVLQGAALTGGIAGLAVVAARTRRLKAGAR